VCVIFPLHAPAADWLSAGIKGGLLLGPGDRTTPIGNRTGVGEQRDHVRPYVVGPAVIAKLPVWNLRIEADALYRRFSRDHSIFRGRFGNYSRYSGNTWEFPFLIERRLPGHLFVGGGASFRHIWGVTVEVEQFNGGMAPDPVIPRGSVDIGDRNQGGWVGVGGIERDLGRVHWSLEARYTRWTSLLFQPSRNQTDVMVGFRF
jgi:hypothetical protein